MKKFLLLPLFGLFACTVAGPSTPSPRYVPPPMGPGEAGRAISCVTRNSQYFFHRTEVADVENRSEPKCSSFVKDEMLTIGPNGEVSTDDVHSLEVCTVGPAMIMNGCTVFIDLTCRTSVLTKSYRGWMTWEEDGSRGRGLSSINVIDDRGASCRSSYVVFATRI